jgi:aryl-alcohol dehydrogenase-like predicted oxidoreductase
MIERRSYGSSGFTLPILGIGCWAYGGDEGDYWGLQDQNDVNDVVSKALDVGINYFDSAEAYNDGRSEEALGQALKGRRKEAIIGTKVLPVNVEPLTLRLHCEASLKRLQTDFIDIYMVHWPIVDLSVQEAFAILAKLQAEGKIKSIGVSNFGVHQLQEALITGTRIEVNQLSYSLLSRGIEIDLMSYCARQGIGILTYSPLAQGLLTGKYRSADEMPPVRTRTRHFRGDRAGSRHGEKGAEEETFTAVENIRKISKELQVPMSQVSLAWIMGHSEITCILPGIRNIEQLAENMAGAKLKLSSDMMARLTKISQPVLDKLGSAPDYYQGRNNSRTW